MDVAHVDESCMTQVKHILQKQMTRSRMRGLKNIYSRHWKITIVSHHSRVMNRNLWERDDGVEKEENKVENRQSFGIG